MKILLKLKPILFLILSTTFLALSCSDTPKTAAEWNNVNSILQRIIPPEFPDKKFDITRFGAVGDGKTDCSEAFKLAIETCNKSGGGKVIVPAGIFLTGAIHLKSNVDLHISENATIKFSTDKNKYLPLVFSRWEGVECMNYSALIYAYGQENIAITGTGILDGQASSDNWWNWKGNEKFGWKQNMPDQKKGRDILFQMADDNVSPNDRLMGDGFYLRPNFVQFYKSKNILIQGVTFKNSPMWFIHPVICENVSIIGAKIEGLGPNNDGCDPESSKDVLIKDCSFMNGDDCIAIKSGRNNDGRRLNIPSENIIIQNCKMKDGHGGVVIGSEITGGCWNVFAENCEMDSPNLDRALRIKSNKKRGGVVKNIYMRNVKVGQVKEAVVKLNMHYDSPEAEGYNFKPEFKNIVVQNVTSQKSQYGLFLDGLEESNIENVIIENCRFNGVNNGNYIKYVKGLELISVYINYKIQNDGM